MDPDFNLKQQLQIARELIVEQEAVSSYGSQQISALIADAQRLAELVVALDVWITRGGSIPNKWVENKTP